MQGSLNRDDLEVRTLGTCEYKSPLELSTVPGDRLGDFIPHGRRVLLNIEVEVDKLVGNAALSVEKAGPRDKLFFEPKSTKAAIVTCGGLCPGMNNVIRSVFFELSHNYGVAAVLGIRHGYRGLNPGFELAPVVLTDAFVEEIHKLGGTVLGSSRGPQDAAVVTDFVVAEGIDILFCVGGDGTQRGAHAIASELRQRELPIAVVGIPKTIDNDIPFVDRSFGYLTALAEAQEVIRCAHVEARGAVNGIALVKLMGRNAGFIAAGAALASQEANFVLVPEVDFPLEGDGGLLSALEARVRRRGHAVVIVAEGAGQHLSPNNGQRTDASGNTRYEDIGIFLRDRIRAYFAERDCPISMKYIDPSYTIRSVPANCADRLLCDHLARHAVHAAMAGKTDMMIGLHHNSFIHVPIATVTRKAKQMDVEGDRWTSVLLVTRQPRWTSAADVDHG